MPTIVKIFGININSTPYILVFMSDGSAYAYNVVTAISVLIANPGTFSATGPGDVTEWQGQIALIVDPVFGYFRWPGVGTGSGAPLATLIPAPTVVVGAAGNVDAGAHQWAVTYVIAGTETNQGIPSTTLTLAIASQVQLSNIPLGPTGTTARKIYRTAANQAGPFKLLTTISDNTTTSFLDNVADSGLGANAPAEGAVTPGSPGHQWAVSFISGSGESALSDPSAVLVLGGAHTVLITNIAIGPAGTTARNLYRTALATPTTYQLVTTINDNSTAQFSDTLADSALGAVFGGQSSNLVSSLDGAKVGTTLAAYAGRVWISNNRTTQYTAPNTYNDFSIGDAGGSFVMTDNNFKGAITKLLNALDVLWIFGESAINQLSNVTVLANSTTTTFSNINVSSSVGTIFPQSVISFLRQIEFATKYGIIQQIGVTPQRISEKLDGTYKLLDLSQPVTAGLIQLNSILCYALMVTYLDPDNAGAPRKIILIVSFDGKWFIGSQGDQLRLMCSTEYQGSYRLFGADDHNLYELFVQPHYPIHKLKTPFFDQGDLTAGKSMIRAGVLFNYEETQVTEVTMTPQTAVRTLQTPGDPVQSNVLQFTPPQGSFLQFSGITIVTKGYSFPQWNLGAYSKLVAFDLAVNNDPFEILAYSLDVESLESWGDFK
jgi:hypothetical protein